MNEHRRGLPVPARESFVPPNLKVLGCRYLVLLLENPNHGKGIERSTLYGLCRREAEKLISLFPVAVLLELDLTRLLDEVANMAAAGSEAVGTTVAGDIVTVTSVASLDHLCGG